MLPAFLQLFLRAAIVAAAATDPAAMFKLDLDLNSQAVSEFLEKETKGYDFVLAVSDDLTRVSEDGWLIYVTPEAYEYLNQLTDLAYITLMGYFSKGKTRIASMLFNAGQLNKSSKQFQEVSGKGVTTLGLSGVLAGSPTGDIANSTIVIIDLPGRNAPARRQGRSLADMSTGVSSMRAKERMMDHIASRMSDLIIYVVNEVLNEDQRAIGDLVKQKFRGDSKSDIVVMHNMMNVDCQDKEEAHSLAEEMIRGAFGAEPIPADPDMAPDTAWRSRWVDDATGDVLYIYHFMIFNDDIEECKVTNMKTIKYVSDFRFNRVEARIVRDATPLEYLRRHLEEVLPDYLYVSDEPSVVNQADFWNSPSRSTQYGRLVVNSSTNLRLRNWDTVDKPFISTRDYKPAYARDQNRTHSLLRVEASGIERLVAMGEDPPVDESWIQFYAADNVTSRGHVQTVIVEGVRYRPPGAFTDSTNYGAFRIEAELEFFFNHHQVNFKAGCLDVVSSHKEWGQKSVHSNAVYFGAAVASAIGALIAFLLLPSRRRGAVDVMARAVHEPADPAARAAEEAAPTSSDSLDKLVTPPECTEAEEEEDIPVDGDGAIFFVGDAAAAVEEEDLAADSDGDAEIAAATTDGLGHVIDLDCDGEDNEH